MSKATNRLIQEQVNDGRRNTGLTTIIAVAVSGYRHLAPLAGPRRDLDTIREIFVENPATSSYKEEQLITLLAPTSAQLSESVLQYAEARGAR